MILLYYDFLYTKNRLQAFVSGTAKNTGDGSVQRTQGTVLCAMYCIIPSVSANREHEGSGFDNTQLRPLCYLVPCATWRCDKRTVPLSHVTLTPVTLIELLDDSKFFRITIAESELYLVTNFFS